MLELMFHSSRLMTCQQMYKSGSSRIWKNQIRYIPSNGYGWTAVSPKIVKFWAASNAQLRNTAYCKRVPSVASQSVSHAAALCKNG